MSGEILAILPAYNEEVSIGSIVLHARQHADRVIVIDDGSSDRTTEMAKLAGAEVIRHPFNKGKGAALKTGFKEASKNGTRVIVTMDTDGQHDPEEIPKLIAPILSGEADMVNGSRYMNGNGNKKISQHITDPQSRYRAFSRRFFDYFRIEDSNFGAMKAAGMNVIEVPIGSNGLNNSHLKIKNNITTIVAMPAYNEERSIAKVILDCKKLVDLVVVVDDGSKDSTAEIAEALGAYVVRHPENQGYGAALQSCFETARLLGADKMVIIDSDGQHNPAEIPKLLDSLKNGVDMVIGSRFINGNGKNVPVYRKVGMKVLDTATNIAGGVQISDSQSGFRAYGKKAIETIRIKDTDMSAGSEILLQIKENNLNFKEVEIHCNYDVEDASSQNPVSHGVKVLVQILRDMELRKPLYYFTVPGIFFTVVGLGMGIGFLDLVRTGGHLPFGPTLFMIMVTLIGILSVFTGIILHTLSGLIRNLQMNNQKTA